MNSVARASRGVCRLLRPDRTISMHPETLRAGKGRLARAAVRVVGLLLLFVVPGARAGAASPEPVRRVLPNGMVVIVKENHSAPVVSIQALVRVGSTAERDNEAGMAHLHEHMLFKGTRTRPVGSIARAIEAAGGDINAYTSWDQTVYFVDIASRFADLGVDILADILENATFDPGELEKEKEVVLEEIRRSRDMPESRLSEAFFLRAYETHPYRNPVIGRAETVQAVTRDTILDFYRRWYVPAHVVWVVVGDVETERFLPALEARLAKIEARPAPERVRIQEPPQREPRAVVLQADVKQAYVHLGFHIPGIAHPDVPALDLLAQVLGGGRSSRLYQALRMKKRVVNTVGAYSMTPADPGMFLISATLEPSNLEEALSDLLREVFRMAAEPAGEDELRRAKAQIESDFIYQQETAQGQARELASYEALCGDLEFGRKYLEAVRALGVQDLLAVGRKYLQPSNATVAVLLPSSKDSAWNEEGLLRILAACHEPFSLPQSPTPGTPDASSRKVVKVDLANGGRLLVKESHEVPVVALYAAFLAGLPAETAETNGVGNFMASMLTQGTSSRSAVQIAEEIESLAGSLSGFSGRDSFGLQAEVVSWNFAPALRLFADCLLHPAFPEEELEKKRQDILAAIQNQEDNLARCAFQLFWNSLYPGCPYGMDPLGTLDTVRSLNREDLLAHYNKYAVGKNFVLAIAGDVSAEKAIEMAQVLFEPLPAHGPEGAVPAVSPCNTKPMRESSRAVSAEKLQAHLVVGSRGTIHADPDRYALSVLDAILSGQGGRLFVDLRDRQSLAYSVTSFTREGMQPGAVGVYIATSPEKRERALKGILRHLRRIRDKQVSEEELARAKNYLIGAYELGLQTQSAQAALMAHDELYGLGAEAYKEYAEKIQAVSAADVKRVARKYLDPKNLVRVEVLPDSARP